IDVGALLEERSRGVAVALHRRVGDGHRPGRGQDRRQTPRSGHAENDFANARHFKLLGGHTGPPLPQATVFTGSAAAFRSSAAVLLPKLVMSMPRSFSTVRSGFAMGVPSGALICMLPLIFPPPWPAKNSGHRL